MWDRLANLERIKGDVERAIKTIKTQERCFAQPVQMKAVIVCCPKCGLEMRVKLEKGIDLRSRCGSCQVDIAVGFASDGILSAYVVS